MPKPVQLAVEVERRVDLILRRELRRLGDHLIEDRRVRLGMQNRPAIDELVPAALGCLGVWREAERLDAPRG